MSIQVASVLEPYMVETVTTGSLHHGCRPLELHTPTGWGCGCGNTMRRQSLDLQVAVSPGPWKFLGSRSCFFQGPKGRRYIAQVLSPGHFNTY